MTSQHSMPPEAGPLVTIVTVVWNAVDALRSTIESVAHQRYPSIEYVVVDGGSSDGTAELIRSTESVISRWVSERDRGLYDAMNKGMRLASGEFVLFMNAGDTFVTDDALTRLATRITDRDAIYFGNVRLTDCTGRLRWEVPIRRRGGPPPTNYRPHHQSILYPRWFTDTHEYSITIGYRADAQFTEQAWSACRHNYVDVTLIDSTLGGMSSKAITSLSELRAELKKETAFARQSARSGRVLPVLDIAASVVVKYVASKIGGEPLMHRWMFFKHRLRARVSR